MVSRSTSGLTGRGGRRGAAHPVPPRGRRRRDGPLPRGRPGRSLEATRQRHLGHGPRPVRYDPDLWTDEYAFLSRPGQADIQTELFFDYRTNVSAYPAWQRWLRQAQPPLLVLWGTYDPSFLAAEAEAYRADVPSAQVHLLDGGHFVLDTRAADVARLVRAFVTGTESAA
jgi:pimeloyl-ACP methyl ester carboxylesterase